MYALTTVSGLNLSRSRLPNAVFVTLLYAAVKNIKPQDVIRQALGKQAIGGAIAPTVNDTLPPASGVPVVTT